MKIYGEYLNLKKNYVIFIISRQSSSAGIEALLESYPDFKELYGEIYELCRNVEKVMEMFSKELKELDRNTVQYMIDEMQEEIDGMRRELSDKNISTHNVKRSFTKEIPLFCWILILLLSIKRYKLQVRKSRRVSYLTREDELFEKLKRGDPDAAGELARLYYDDILRYCLFHVPDRSLAQDAVQETFLKVFRYFGDYRHRGHFRAFLYRVAANVCADIRRRRTWEPMPEQVSFEEKGLREGEDREDFRRLVELLPEELREIVILRFAQELKLGEIAKAADLPMRTVQSRLRKALKILKTELEGREEK